MFFGSSIVRESNGDDKFDTGSITEAFDDIDDEELLQLPDPSMIQNAHQTTQWTSTSANLSAFQNQYSQGGNFESNHDSRIGHSTAQRNIFSSDIDLTPIQPSFSANHHHSRGHYNEKSSIIPDSFVQHTRHGYGYTPRQSVGGMPSFRPSHAGGSHRGNYQRHDGYDQPTPFFRQFM
jgi:hypothetical protein